MTLARLATLLAAAAAAAAPRALAAAPARGLLQDGAACQQGGGAGACEANTAYYVENSGWFDALDAAYDRFRDCTDFRQGTGCRSGAHAALLAFWLSSSLLDEFGSKHNRRAQTR